MKKNHLILLAVKKIGILKNIYKKYYKITKELCILSKLKNGIWASKKKFLQKIINLKK